jgi:hypothetical protein
MRDVNVYKIRIPRTTSCQPKIPHLPFATYWIRCTIRNGQTTYFVAKWSGSITSTIHRLSAFICMTRLDKFNIFSLQWNWSGISRARCDLALRYGQDRQQVTMWMYSTRKWPSRLFFSLLWQGETVYLCKLRPLMDLLCIVGMIDEWVSIVGRMIREKIQGEER